MRCCKNGKSAPGRTFQLREDSGQRLDGAHDVHVTSGKVGGRATHGQLGRGGEMTAAAWHAYGNVPGEWKRVTPRGGGVPIAATGLKPLRQPHVNPTGRDRSHPGARTMFYGQ